MTARADRPALASRSNQWRRSTDSACLSTSVSLWRRAPDLLSATTTSLPVRGSTNRHEGAEIVSSRTAATRRARQPGPPAHRVVHDLPPQVETSSNQQRRRMPARGGLPLRFSNGGGRAEYERVRYGLVLGN